MCLCWNKPEFLQILTFGGLDGSELSVLSGLVWVTFLVQV